MSEIQCLNAESREVEGKSEPTFLFELLLGGWFEEVSVVRMLSANVGSWA